MTRPHPFRALVLALVALLAACSASGDLTVGTPDAGLPAEAATAPAGGFTPQTLRALAEESLAATSGRAEMSLSMSMAGLPDLPRPIELAFGADGEWDASGNERAVLDMSGMADMMDEMLSMSGEQLPPGMAGMFDAYREPIEIRVVDGRTYLTSGFFNGLLAMIPVGRPVPTPWLSVDTTSYASADVGSMFGSDPAMARDVLQLLRGIARIDEVGTDVVRGATVQHLRAEVTLAALIDAASTAEERAELESLWAELSSTGGFDVGAALDATSFVIDLWIDGDATLHRMAMEVDLLEMMSSVGVSASDAGLPPNATMTMSWAVDYFDFGAAVSIDAPPADQVTDATDLFERLSAMGGF